MYGKVYPRYVYVLQHIQTGKIYIGSSKNPNERHRSHIWALRGHYHVNKEMQEDFDAFGGTYSFKVVDEINSDSERVKERDWMLRYNSNNPKFGYNSHDQYFTSAEKNKRRKLERLERERGG